MSDLEFISANDFQQKVVETMKELAWVATGEVIRTQKEKDELAIQANQLVEKFRDFVIN